MGFLFDGYLIICFAHRWPTVAAVSLKSVSMAVMVAVMSGQWSGSGVNPE